MPFTPNRQFKAKPRLLARASGMHYWTPDGRQILDGVAGLWCVNAGHGRHEITEAVANQLETMDYAPPFQMGHPAAFALANELVKIAPRGSIMFLHQLRFRSRRHGAEDRPRLAPRARGCHAYASHRPRGAGTTGSDLAVFGRWHLANRKAWSTALLPGVDHRSTRRTWRRMLSRAVLRHTRTPRR